jgi:hypothetical protein
VNRTDEVRDALRRLQEIPNIGPAMAADLVKLGILRLEDAAGKDPDEMYQALCVADGVRHDPCVRDVFAAVVAHAGGEPPQPWWVFSRRRKEAQGAKRRLDK